ncbi:MAG TPA: hypothetical protein VK524_14725 [Polyangiaceae bacterium]|nr:hypothetical protein [Polyangiaceae bacterium]
MSLIVRMPWAAGFLTAAAVHALSIAAHAASPDKAECARAYEQAQERRVASHLLEAREALRVCAQPSCPGFVQKDCGDWLGQVERELPSVIVTAKSADGSDTAAVKLFIDGKPRGSELDGRAIELDPGLYTFRLEHEGAEPVERRILVRQSQRNRVIEVRFGGDPSPRPTGPSPAAPMADRSSGKPGPLRPYAYVAGGVGAAGVVAWSVFGLLGKKQENDLKDECAGHCSESDVDSVKRKYLLADISLGVGVVGLGTGVLLFVLSRPKERESSTAGNVSFHVTPQAGGGRALFSTRF